MSTARDRRKAQARQRHKERRAVKQSERRSRTRSPRASGRDAHTWPLGDAWISQGWFEPEATVHAVLSRVHEDGSAVCVAMEVDLAHDGLVRTQVRTGLPEAAVSGFAADFAPEDTLMLADPTAVARLFEDGLRQREEVGLADLSGLEQVQRLLAGVDADESPFDYRFGDGLEDEPTEEVPRVGLVGRIRGWFGG